MDNANTCVSLALYVEKATCKLYAGTKLGSIYMIRSAHPLERDGISLSEFDFIEASYADTYVETSEGRSTLHLPSNSDMYATVAVGEIAQTELMDPRVETLVVDFSGVNSMSLLMIREVIRVLRSARRANTPLEFVRPNAPEVEAMIEKTQLNRVFWPKD